MDKQCNGLTLQWNRPTGRQATGNSRGSSVMMLCTLALRTGLKSSYHLQNLTTKFKNIAKKPISWYNYESIHCITDKNYW